jgi:hypothetical protein
VVEVGREGAGSVTAKKKPALLSDILVGLDLGTLSMLREACASCSIEGNEQGNSAGRALDLWMSGVLPTGPDANSLHGLLLSMLAEGTITTNGDSS